MNCRGMTLLEVLVALAVLALAGLAAIKSTGEQVSNLSHLEKNSLPRGSLKTSWSDYGCKMCGRKSAGMRGRASWPKPLGTGAGAVSPPPMRNCVHWKLK